jgi:hypothetical protein
MSLSIPHLGSGLAGLCGISTHLPDVCGGLQERGNQVRAGCVPNSPLDPKISAQIA